MGQGNESEKGQSDWKGRWKGKWERVSGRIGRGIGKVLWVGEPREIGGALERLL